MASSNHTARSFALLVGPAEHEYGQPEPAALVRAIEGLASTLCKSMPEGVNDIDSDELERLHCTAEALRILTKLLRMQEGDAEHSGLDEIIARRLARPSKAQAVANGAV